MRPTGASANGDSRINIAAAVGTTTAFIGSISASILEGEPTGQCQDDVRAEYRQRESDRSNLGSKRGVLLAALGRSRRVV